MHSEKAQGETDDASSVSLSPPGEGKETEGLGENALVEGSLFEPSARFGVALTDLSPEAESWTRGV